MLKTSHWHCNVSLGAAGDYFWWMAGERVFHAKPTRMQNWILHPCFLRLAVLKKPKAWLFGTIKRSPYISRLTAAGQRQRGKKPWEGAACPLAWHQYSPTLPGALAGQQWPTQARWVSEHDSPQRGEKKSLLELTQNEMGFLYTIKTRNQLKGLIKTSAFLSMSDFQGDFLVLILFLPFCYLIYLI